MRLFIRGSTWWADFRDGEDNRRRVSLNLDASVPKADAMRTALTLKTTSEKAAVSAGSLGAALIQANTRFWSRTKSKREMGHMVNLLVREVGTKDCADVTYAWLQDMGEGWLQSVSPATVNRRMSAISVALREKVRTGQLASRPEIPHWTEPKGRDRYMTFQEQADVMAWLDLEIARLTLERRPEDAAEYQFIRHLGVFLLDTGCRFAESLSFKLVGNQVQLSASDTKSGRGRAVPLTPAAQAAAAAIVADPIRQKLVQMGPKRAWDWCDHRWSRATEKAGCPDVTLHILRHTCASRLVQRGISLLVVKEWLGHASVKITERYAHLAPSSLSQALSALVNAPVAVAIQIPTNPETEATQKNVAQDGE